MAEYTSLQEYKEYKQPSVGSCLDCINTIENNGVTNGDIHYSVINDKCPKANDSGNILYRLTDTSTNTVIEFRMYNSGDNPLNNDPLCRMVWDLDLSPVANSIGLYGYMETSRASSWTQKTVRIVNGVDEDIWTGEGGWNVGGRFDLAFWGGYGFPRLDYLFGYYPTSNSLKLECFAQRCYVLLKTSDDSVDLGNIRYTIISEGSYNYISYLRSIDALDHLLEGAYEEEEGKYNYHTYYFYNKTYEIDGTRIRSIKGEYKGDGRICGYVGNSSQYNIKLIYKGTLEEIINDETEWHTPTLPRLTSNDTLDGYYGLLDTNIPLFGSLSDTLNYLNTGDTDGALNEADIDKTAKTGMDGTEARFERANTYTIEPAFSNIFDISSVQDDLVQWLVSLNDPSIAEETKMFWWQNNPIETVISYYWTPLQISELVTVYTNNHQVTFGGVGARYVEGEHTDRPIRCDRYLVQGDEKLLGQYQFNRKYNDWRDYQLFNYKLYLPFYGLVDLEPYYITGKRLEVKYIYYPTNHTIHYMIFVKQNLYKAIDCVVGVDLPMMSGDVVGKVRSDFTNALGAVGDVEGIVKGNITSGITSLVERGVELNRKPSLLTWGNINPTTNIGDPLQAMLYIEEQQTIIPNNLYNTYGHANYYIGNIGALSGYCEFSDVRLTGCGTLSDNEKEELKGLLMKGVIL